MLWNLKLRLKNGCRYRQVVVVRRWSLAQVWLYKSVLWRLCSINFSLDMLLCFFRINPYQRFQYFKTKLYLSNLRCCSHSKFRKKVKKSYQDCGQFPNYRIWWKNLWKSGFSYEPEYLIFKWLYQRRWFLYWSLPALFLCGFFFRMNMIVFISFLYHEKWIYNSLMINIKLHSEIGILFEKYK